MRQAIGTTVFSGMLGVTLFGLFFTPVFYVVIRAIAKRSSRSRNTGEPTSSAVDGFAGNDN